jgi:hypothetical protein
MNSDSIKSKAFVILAGLGAAAALWFFFPRSPQPVIDTLPEITYQPPSYFNKVAVETVWRPSRRNLEAIGRALQIYRQECDVKPPELRKTYADAGIPPTIGALVKPGHKWTLQETSLFIDPRSLEDLHKGTFSLGYDYSFLPFDYLSKSLKGRAGEALAARGEALPIIVDYCMYPTSGRPEGPLHVWILRLDGRVEQADVDPKDMLDLYFKR